MDRKIKSDPSRQRPYSAVRKAPIDIKFTNQELQSAFESQRSQVKSFNTTKKSEPKPTKPQSATEDKQVGEQGRPQKYVFESAAPLYRFAQPYSGKGQSSNRFWAETNDSNPLLGVNSLNAGKGSQPRSAYPTRPATGISRARRDDTNAYGQDFDKRDYSPPLTNAISPENEYFDQQGLPFDDGATSPLNDLGFKPYAFLSNVGGKQTSLKEISSAEDKAKGKYDKEVTTSRKSNLQNPGDIIIFNNSNVDKVEKTGRLERPHTVSIHDTNSRVLKNSNTTMSIAKTTKRPETSKVVELPDIFDSSSKRPMTAM